METIDLRPGLLTSSSLSATYHASVRLQQRGIPPKAVDLVLTFGVRKRSSGATSIYLDKSARSRMVRTVGPQALRNLGHKLDIYLVISDEGRLVTAAYRDRPVRH